MWRWIAGRGFGHWIRVAVVVALGLYASEAAREHHLWLWADLHMYQWLSELSPRPLKPRHTAIVLIDDDAFWKGPLAARIPLKRTYIARLVEAIDAGGAYVIALDIDFRSANPAGPARTHPDYEAETQELLKVLKAVATSRRLVLSRPVGANASHETVANFSIYDDQHLCDDAPSPHHRLHCGYLELPRDIRMLPPSLFLADGSYLPSFAVATVQARRRQDPNDEFESRQRLRFGSYIPSDTFRKEAVFPSGQILAASREERERKLGGKVVLVGGTWSELAYGRGSLVDLWDTPVGPIPGVFVHANYIEALLDDRVYVPLPGWLEFGVELVILGLCVLAFEVGRSTFRKALAIAALCAALLLTSYFAFQNVGRVFNVFIPLVFLVAHAILEQVLEWRKVALAT